ncbi:MAG: carbon-nitrogen family hydrolase [Lachnospiraceae bacterium]|nr:carbon-nitrogen family hydrolase [Lachnospiraceae bacterium]
MKAALGQLQIHWEDKEANLKKAEAYLELLSEKKTDLFLLPEMSLTGFSMHTERIKEKREETVERMQRLAEKYQVAIGAGWVKDAGALCENHYSIVAPEGRILDYTKLHPFRFGGEAEHFQGGNALPVCDFGGFCVGVQICYDLRFPEPFQILSKKADLILVPANWPAARSGHWKSLLKARAIENMVYVAGINCAGEMGKLFYSGDSRLYAPDGTKLKKETVRLPECGTGERVMVYDLQNDVHSYRECFPVKEDRRERLYQKLQEETWDYERKE